MSKRASVVYAVLLTVVVTVGLVGLISITIRDNRLGDECVRHGLRHWQAGAAFCVDPRNGALYAPQFVRKQ